jgi:hypothetical protein
MSELEQKSLKDALIGMNISDAGTYCKENDIPCRTVRTDGRGHIITMDMRLNRVNFEVNNGVVTFISFG